MTTTDVKPPIPLDERLIADMPFDGGAGTVTLLTRCNVTKAFEIDQLGCTGASGYGLTLDDITSLRIGLGGGGVGLPCFVPPDRYCLAHNTIGGLQREQESRHPANVAAISRELTPQEAGQVMFTETVRRTGKGGVGEQMAAAAGALGGFGEMPRGVEMVEEQGGAEEFHAQRLAASACTCDPKCVNCPRCRTGAFSSAGTSLTLPSSIPLPGVSYAPFTCPEHTNLNWSCRFCVAQAVAEGELDTSFAIHFPEIEVTQGGKEIAVMTCLDREEMDKELEDANTRGVGVVEIYALVKTLTRKLA